MLPIFGQLRSSIARCDEICNILRWQHLNFIIHRNALIHHERPGCENAHPYLFKDNVMLVLTRCLNSVCVSWCFPTANILKCCCMRGSTRLRCIPLLSEVIYIRAYLWHQWSLDSLRTGIRWRDWSWTNNNLFTQIMNGFNACSVNYVPFHVTKNS